MACKAGLRDRRLSPASLSDRRCLHFNSVLALSTSSAWVYGRVLLPARCLLPPSAAPQGAHPAAGCTP